MVGGPCRRRPPAPDVECGGALPGRRNENTPERWSHFHVHGRVIYDASGRHRTGHRSCMLLCKSQKTVGRFQGKGRPCSGICSGCLLVVWLVAGVATRVGKSGRDLVFRQNVFI